MNSKIALIVGSTLLAALAAPAMANQELAQKKACMACHAIDKKVVGPAFLDIAKKYKGQKGIEAKLAEKVIKGGGVWGTMAMPANAQVTPAEATQLVKWVLTLK